MNKTKSNIWWIIAGVICVVILIFLMCVYFFDSTVSHVEWIQVMLTAALVSVTAFYAWEARKQALTGIQTVEEMRKQTLMQSRPVIIQKAVNVGPRYLTLDDPNVVTTKSFSHFNIMNTGNGPAIELEMSLLDKDKNTIYSHRETYLKAGDEIEFSGALLFNHPESKFYLLCQYNATFALNTRKIWYQTWLPLEVSRGTSKKIFVAPGELVFCEVNEKDRVISFVSKPS